MKFVNLVFLSALVVTSGIACKQKTEKKSTPPPVTTNPTGNPVNPNNASPIITIEVVGQTGNTFQYNQNDIVQLRFRITGTSAQSNLVAALSEMPAGGQLTGRDTAEPVFTWTATVQGTQYVTLLVRDRDACVRAGATDCEISEQQFGSINPNVAYDVTQRYTIVVGTGTGTTTGTTGTNTIGNTISTILGGNTLGTGASGFLGNAFGAIGNVFSNSGSFIWNMGSSFLQYIKGLFT